VSRPGSEGRSQAADSGDLRFDDAFLRRLERLSLRAHRVTGAAGGRPGTLRIPAADFIDHRPYSPGDDQRHIDWPAAARHDALFVKVGRAAQAASVHLLLDVSASMAAPSRKWLLARQLVAALGWMSLVHGDRVSVDCFPLAQGQSCWGPFSGAGRGRGLLAFVSSLAPRHGRRTNLLPAVKQAVNARQTGGLLVLVSDLWVVDDLDSALSFVRPPRWEALVLQVLGRGELAPSRMGALELEDSESGETLTLDVDEAALAEYRTALNARLERLRQLAGRHGAGYALLPADWPLERAVVPYLQRRMILGG
jgi:uncharacterized protein (DUF58 family)